MNYVRRAAYFNSTGASMLAFGENGKAFKSFKTSLQCLAQAILHADETAPTVAAGAAAGGGRDTSSEMITRAVPRSSMDPTKDPKNHVDEDGNPYFYCKGLVFYPNTTLTMIDLAFYSSVVVFNLVLTYQKTKTKNQKDHDFRKMLQLYDLCLRLISEGSKTNEYDCSNLLLAALNNKSVVHSQLGEHGKARRMLYHVFDVIRYPETRPQLLEPWEVEGLFLNIFLILVNSPQVASAA